MLKQLLISLFALAPLVVFGQQPVNGANITTATVAPSKITTQPANTLLGNCTGSTSAITACNAAQTKASLAINYLDISGLGTIATQNANGVAITGGSVSGANVTATGTTLSVPLADRFARCEDPQNFGAIPNDGIDDTAAFQAAITSAYSRGTNTVCIGPGTFDFPAASASINPGVGPLTVYGAPDQTILKFNEGTNATPKTLINNTSNVAKGDLTFEGLTFRGTFDTRLINQGGLSLTLDHYNSVTFHRVAFRFLSGLSQSMSFNNRVIWDDCQFTDIARDAARARDSFYVQITNSYFARIGDDSVTAHMVQYTPTYNPADGTPRSEGLVITGNIFRDVRTVISALGGSKSLISNNIASRFVGGAVFIDLNGTEGPFQKNSIRITNNHFFDQITSIYSTIQVSQITPQGGTDTSGVIPATPAVTTGAFADPFGSFNNDINTQATKSIPFSSDIEVSNNTLARTLPLVSNYSAWGYGKPGSTTYGSDLAIALADLRPAAGITIPGGLRNVVSENRISSVSTGIFLVMPTTLNPGTFSSKISGNTIYDANATGIYVSGSGAVRADLSITNNDINTDPYRTNSNSLANGGYTNAFANPSAINTSGYTGVSVVGNKIQNSARALVATDRTRLIVGGNIIVALPVVVGSSTSNTGVAQIFNAGEGFKYIIANPDATSATWAQDSFEQYTSAASVPTAGTWVTGAFVQNTAAAVVNNGLVLQGWLRLTTGATNISGADWSPSYTLLGTNFIFGDGSAASPGTGFSSDAGLGWYRSSAGTMSLAANGVEQFRLTTTPAAANFIKFSAVTAGQAPIIGPVGTDSNISVLNTSKGSGSLNFYTNNTASFHLRIVNNSSVVNRIDLMGGAAGVGPSLSAAGSDTNVDFRLIPQGAGLVTSTTGFKAATSLNAPVVNVTGSTSGVVSILPQAAAGTYNYNLPITSGASGQVLTSGGGGAAPMTWSAAAIAPLSATTVAIGGAALIAGQCASTTVTVTGATTAMVPTIAPAGGVSPGANFYWDAYVSAVNTVTANVCAAVAGTPTSLAYNIRVIQ